MASRKSRSETRQVRSKNRSRSDLRQNNSMNITKAEMLDKLKQMDVSLPNSTEFETVKRIYEKMANAENNSSDNTNSTTKSTELNQNDRLMDEFKEMQASVAELRRKVEENKGNGNKDNIDNVTGLNVVQERRSLEELPSVTIVSDAVRKDIHAHRYVNLARLLIPGTDSTSNETHIIDENGRQIVMKARDSRLAKSLNIHEFRSAFAKFKTVLCEAEPHRRKELDLYGEQIDDMFFKYGGVHFYEYHLAFAQKAAQYEIKNIPIDWSKRDRDLYMTVFSGLRSNACGACGGLEHTTAFCPYDPSSTSFGSNTRRRGYFNSQNSTSPYNRTIDKYGRKRSFHQGKEVCNNFNDHGFCKVLHKTEILHICSQCFADTHGATNCPKITRPTVKKQQ